MEWPSALWSIFLCAVLCCSVERSTSFPVNGIDINNVNQKKMTEPRGTKGNGWIYWNAYMNHTDTREIEIIQVYGLSLNNCRARYDQANNPEKILFYDKWMCSNRDDNVYQTQHTDKNCQSTPLRTVTYPKEYLADTWSINRRVAPIRTEEFGYQLFCTVEEDLPIPRDVHFAVNLSYNILKDCMHENIIEFSAYKEGTCFFPAWINDNFGIYVSFDLPSISYFIGYEQHCSAGFRNTDSVSINTCRVPTAENYYTTDPLEPDFNYATDDTSAEIEKRTDDVFDDDWRLGWQVPINDDHPFTPNPSPQRLYSKWRKIYLPPKNTLQPGDSQSPTVEPTIKPTSAPTKVQPSYTITIKQKLLGMSAAAYLSNLEENNIIFIKSVTSLLGFKMNSVQVLSVADARAANRALTERLEYYVTPEVATWVKRILAPTESSCIVTYKVVYSLSELPPKYTTPDAAYQYISVTLSKTIQFGGFKTTLKHYAGMRNNSHMSAVSASSMQDISAYLPLSDPPAQKQNWAASNISVIAAISFVMFAFAGVYWWFCMGKKAMIADINGIYSLDNSVTGRSRAGTLDTKSESPVRKKPTNGKLIARNLEILNNESEHSIENNDGINLSLSRFIEPFGMPVIADFTFEMEDYETPPTYHEGQPTKTQEDEILERTERAGRIRNEREIEYLENIAAAAAVQQFDQFDSCGDLCDSFDRSKYTQMEQGGYSSWDACDSEPIFYI